MVQEIVCTTAKQGLDPDASGFCTVVRSPDLPRELQHPLEKLNSLAGGRHDGHLHATIEKGDATVHLVGRLKSPGMNTSRRTVACGHFLFPDDNELPELGPAWLASQPIYFGKWDKEPCQLYRVIELPDESIGDRAGQAWGKLKGESAWSTVLAEAAQAGEPVWVLYPAGTSCLQVFMEASLLLSEEDRWKATFCTDFDSETFPSELTCLWRGVPEGSREIAWLRANPGSRLINLTGSGASSERRSAGRRSKPVGEPVSESPSGAYSGGGSGSDSSPAEADSSSLSAGAAPRRGPKDESNEPPRLKSSNKRLVGESPQRRRRIRREAVPEEYVDETPDEPAPSRRVVRRKPADERQPSQTRRRPSRDTVDGEEVESEPSSEARPRRSASKPVQDQPERSGPKIWFGRVKQPDEDEHSAPDEDQTGRAEEHTAPGAENEDKSVKPRRGLVRDDVDEKETVQPESSAKTKPRRSAKPAQEDPERTGPKIWFGRAKQPVAAGEDAVDLESDDVAAETSESQESDAQVTFVEGDKQAAGSEYVDSEDGEYDEGFDFDPDTAEYDESRDGVDADADYDEDYSSAGYDDDFDEDDAEFTRRRKERRKSRTKKSKAARVSDKPARAPKGGSGASAALNMDGRKAAIAIAVLALIGAGVVYGPSLFSGGSTGGPIQNPDRNPASLGTPDEQAVAAIRTAISKVETKAATIRKWSGVGTEPATIDETSEEMQTAAANLSSPMIRSRLETIRKASSDDYKSLSAAVASAVGLSESTVDWLARVREIRDLLTESDSVLELANAGPPITEEQIKELVEKLDEAVLTGLPGDLRIEFARHQTLLKTAEGYAGEPGPKLIVFPDDRQPAVAERSLPRVGHLESFSIAARRFNLETTGPETAKPKPADCSAEEVASDVEQKILRRFLVYDEDTRVAEIFIRGEPEKERREKLELLILLDPRLQRENAMQYVFSLKGPLLHRTYRFAESVPETDVGDDSNAEKKAGSGES